MDTYGELKEMLREATHNKLEPATEVVVMQAVVDAYIKGMNAGADIAAVPLKPLRATA